jgi:hypothetical protein
VDELIALQEKELDAAVLAMTKGRSTVPSKLSSASSISVHSLSPTANQQAGEWWKEDIDEREQAEQEDEEDEEDNEQERPQQQRHQHQQKRLQQYREEEKDGRILEATMGDDSRCDIKSPQNVETREEREARVGVAMEAAVRKGIHKALAGAQLGNVMTVMSNLPFCEAGETGEELVSGTEAVSDRSRDDLLGQYLLEGEEELVEAEEHAKKTRVRWEHQLLEAQMKARQQQEGQHQLLGAQMKVRQQQEGQHQLLEAQMTSRQQQEGQQLQVQPQELHHSAGSRGNAGLILEGVPRCGAEQRIWLQRQRRRRTRRRQLQLRRLQPQQQRRPPPSLTSEQSERQRWEDVLTRLLELGVGGVNRQSDTQRGVEGSDSESYSSLDSESSSLDSGSETGSTGSEMSDSDPASDSSSDEGGFIDGHQGHDHGGWQPADSVMQFEFARTAWCVTADGDLVVEGEEEGKSGALQAELRRRARWRWGAD